MVTDELVSKLVNIKFGTFSKLGVHSTWFRKYGVPGFKSTVHGFAGTRAQGPGT